MGKRKNIQHTLDPPPTFDPNDSHNAKHASERRSKAVPMMESNRVDDDDSMHGGNSEGEDDEIRRADDDVEGEDDEIENVVKKPRKPKKKKDKGIDVRAVNMLKFEGPFGGGPRDARLLHSFYDHIACQVWYGKERACLRPIHHTTNLCSWQVTPEMTHFNQRLCSSGLKCLSDALPTINKALVSAFIERWHPETNSFHLPVGEMTITLDDVKHITGLSVDGRLVKCSGFEVETNEEDTNEEERRRLMMEKGVALVHRCLGIAPELIRAEFKKNNDHLCLRMKWIKDRLCGKEVASLDSGGESDSEEDEHDEEPHGRKHAKQIAYMDCTVRGYLLYSLGCTLFADKSGSKVPIHYLECLEDLAEVKNIAFGTSGLAHLCKEMGASSKADICQIAGLLALLEVWIYEHFPFLAGNLVKTYDDHEPRMKRWTKANGVKNPELEVVKIRQQIDKMGHGDVIWDPYSSTRSTTRPVPEVAFYEGYISCLNVKVAYLPSRVLRQFGFVQNIPYLPNDCGAYWDEWRVHVLAATLKLPIIAPHKGYADDYYEWYYEHSHPKVQNSDHWNEDISAPTTIASSSNISLDDTHFHAAKSEGFLAAVLRKGSTYSGKAWNEIKKAHEELILCRGGSESEFGMIVDKDAKRKLPVVRKSNKKKNKK